MNGFLSTSAVRKLHFTFLHQVQTQKKLPTANLKPWSTRFCRVHLQDSCPPETQRPLPLLRKSRMPGQAGPSTSATYTSRIPATCPLSLLSTSRMPRPFERYHSPYHFLGKFAANGVIPKPAKFQFAQEEPGLVGFTIHETITRPTQMPMDSILMVPYRLFLLESCST